MHQLFRCKSVQRRYNRTFIELLLCARLCTKHLSILFNLNFVAILRSSCNSVTHTDREVQLRCTDLLLAALVLVAVRPSLFAVSRGCLVVMRGLLIEVVSLLVEHRL